MTYTEQAIEIACKNGYDVSEKLEYGHSRLLDHLFFQALGRGLGWGEDENNTWDKRTWASHWHRLIDHLAEGKDIESFFEQLIN